MRAGGARTEGDTERFITAAGKQLHGSKPNGELANANNSNTRWLALMTELSEERPLFRQQRERLIRVGIPVYRSTYPIQFLETVGELPPTSWLDSPSD